MTATAESEQIKLLRTICEELREIKEILASTTNDGSPLTALLPSAELVMSASVVAGLLAKELPSMSQEDLQQRVNNAMIIAWHAIAAHSSFMSETKRARLENTLQQP